MAGVGRLSTAHDPPMTVISATSCCADEQHGSRLSLSRELALEEGWNLRCPGGRSVFRIQGPADWAGSPELAWQAWPLDGRLPHTKRCSSGPDLEFLSHALWPTYSGRPVGVSSDVLPLRAVRCFDPPTIIAPSGLRTLQSACWGHGLCGGVRFSRVPADETPECLQRPCSSPLLRAGC